MSKKKLDEAERHVAALLKANTELHTYFNKRHIYLLEQIGGLVAERLALRKQLEAALARVAELEVVAWPE